mgnify:CR=1 FL=1
MKKEDKIKDKIKIEISWQSINKTWGVLYKKNNVVNFEVDRLLPVALFNMGKFINKLPIK